MKRILMAVLIAASFSPLAVSAQGLALSFEFGGDFGGQEFARTTIPVYDCTVNSVTGVRTCSTTPHDMPVNLTGGAGGSLSAGLDIFVFERGGHVLETQLDLGFMGQSDGADDASMNFRRVTERALLLYRNQRLQIRVGGGLFNVSSAAVSSGHAVFKDFITHFDTTPGFTALVGWAHPWLGLDLRFTRVLYQNQSAPGITYSPIHGWSLGFAFRFTIPLFGKTPCQRAYPIRRDFSGCRLARREREAAAAAAAEAAGDVETRTEAEPETDAAPTQRGWLDSR